MRITVGDYLIKKLKSLNITEVFGLPGDYNFEIVEAIEKTEGISWIGCTNELNAGYAADGYARIKGFSALVTTFGVGELSAMNAIAGAMAENVPVIKIVGVPRTKLVDNKILVHHNLDNADYKAFLRAYSNVTQESSFLSKENAKQEIDRLFDIAKKYRKPVYLAIPMDVVIEEVEDNIEEEKIQSNEDNLNLATKEIISLIKKAKNPVVLVDGLVKRFFVTKEVNKFLLKTNLLSTTLIRGIDVINNSTPNYLGVYCGSRANQTSYQILNDSDCIVALGTVLSDLNTFGFDYSFNLDNHINIQPHYVEIKNKRYDNIEILDLIKNLAEKIDYKFDKNIERTYKPKKVTPIKNENLTYDYLFNRINSFIKKDDIIITEVGLPTLASGSLELKDGVRVENQVLWGSIGWATPCAMGCAFSNKNSRVILITGEGAHQLSAQEISTMMRNNLKPIIFVVNNKGYTIERLLCDNPEYKYNDIASWNYSMLPKAFKGDCFSAQVKTQQELEEVLAIIEQNEKMSYIELCFDYKDVPQNAIWAIKHPQFFQK